MSKENANDKLKKWIEGMSIKKCSYCGDEIEEGYTGFEEGMCEICFDFYKEEEEEYE